MTDKRLLRNLRIRNLLSYGDPGVDVDLQRLNVLIGPNASGKSNLIEAVGVLTAAPRSIASVFKRGGGVNEWLWRHSGSTNPTAQIEALVGSSPHVVLRFSLRFAQADLRPEVVEEEIEEVYLTPERIREGKGHRYYQYDGRSATIRVQLPEGRQEHTLGRNELNPAESILSQRRDPNLYPEITFLSDQFSRIRVYREWNVGYYSPARMPQRADLPTDFLAEDASNLALILNSLSRFPRSQDQVASALRKLYPEAERYTVLNEGGALRVFITEGHSVVPASRLSDGTMRYLCLLSILCHPEPPPLICIEEPEIGLHPDAIRDLAPLLEEASQRTQIIVTTHSDILVSALSDNVESVVVCERDSDGSHLRRLDSEKLKSWLDKYSLGELWAMGEIGGNRW